MESNLRNLQTEKSQSSNNNEKGHYKAKDGRLLIDVKKYNRNLWTV